MGNIVGICQVSTAFHERTTLETVAKWSVFVQTVPKSFKQRKMRNFGQWMNELFCSIGSSILQRSIFGEIRG